MARKMSWRLFAVTLAFASVFSFVPEASHAISIPRAVIDSSRTFTTEGTGTEEVERLEGNFIATILYSPSALQSCGLDREELRRRMTVYLGNKAFLQNEFSLLFDEPLKELGQRDLNIVVTSFGDGRMQGFGGFHRPNFLRKGDETIFLDCAPKSVLYWGPALMHDLTHVLLHRVWPGTREKDSPEIWLDEGLAQLMEIEAGGEQPLKRIELFRSASEIPRLTETRRPFPEDSNYAMSFLFALYLRDRWAPLLDKSQVLKAFVGLTPSQACDRDSSLKDDLARGACRLKELLISKNADAALVEKTTRSGLLRHFAVALVLNTDQFPLYWIPFWQGFREAPVAKVLNLALAPDLIARHPVTQLSQLLEVVSRVPPATKPRPELYALKRPSTDAETFKIKPLMREEPLGEDELILFINPAPQMPDRVPLKGP
jgi:hypothetical protein